MRILWFSNRVLEDQHNDRTGTWLFAFAQQLSFQDGIILGNISLANVKNTSKKDYRNISQWIVPYRKLKKNGLPPDRLIDEIRTITKEFSPDIIQIWGTEGYWGLLVARQIIKARSILNIQGLFCSIVPVFYGGLSFAERLMCIGIKEVVRPSGLLYFSYYQSKRLIALEEEIIKAHNVILCQSEWVSSQIHFIKDSFTCYEVERSLRPEIIASEKWNSRHKNGTLKPTLFTSSIMQPYKGLHILIKAIAYLKSDYPDVVLNIAGAYSPPGIRRSGYERWVRRMIKNLGLEHNVNWLGSLNANDLADQLRDSSVFINPSYIESYSLSLAEALYIGTPSVCSFAGAMPNLAKDEEHALFFSPGDYVNCAYQIRRYLTDFALASRISQSAVEVSCVRHNPDSIMKTYLDIYKKLTSNPS